MRRIAAAFFLLFLANVRAQPEGLPRRIEDPRTIVLPGGSRIEFGSFFAPSLNREADFSIYLPPRYDELKPADKLPVVYLLHGMWNDHTSWVVERYGSIPEKLERMILDGRVPRTLVVSPNGENSFYTDFLDGTLMFEQMVHNDLIAMVESTYQARSDRRGRAITGVSMGGYGALKIAMKYPETYASVAAVSPIVFTGPDPSASIIKSDSRIARYFRTTLKPVYGMPFEPEHWRKNSLEVLARECDPKGLRIYFSYGTADRYNRLFPMRKGVETLNEILTERGISHEFKLIENGPHGWGLVEGQLEDLFTFLTQTF